MDTATHPTPGDSLWAFYVDVLHRLKRARIPLLVGGAFAHSRYTARDRDTKDVDIIVRPAHVDRTLAVAADAGYDTALSYPHWLAKIQRGPDCLDVVFGSGNGVIRIDDAWFAHAVPAPVLGMTLPLCPAEELLWSTAFVQERERFDGADILHLLRDRGAVLNWDRLLDRFGPNWPVLLGHIVMFQFAYPDRRNAIPRAVLDVLTTRFAALQHEPDNHVCFGTLLSREQYLFDLDRLGYEDARLPPYGRMSRAETEIWTRAIGGQQEEPPPRL
jgi:hypothetical protein